MTWYPMLLIIVLAGGATGLVVAVLVARLERESHLRQIQAVTARAQEELDQYQANARAARGTDPGAVATQSLLAARAEIELKRLGILERGCQCR